MGTAALLASVAAALYFMATGVSKPKKKDDKKPAQSEKQVAAEEPVLAEHQHASST